MIKSLLLFFTTTFLLHLYSCAQVNSINRPIDPVVLSGKDLSMFIGKSPNDIVAFKYSNSNWTQIPVQIDEKVVLDIVAPYGPYAVSKFGTSSTGIKETFYADVATYVGADTDAAFDGDDELVFMIKDAGEKTSASDPDGVSTGSRIQVSITDPLDNKTDYAYLFENAGTLKQDAGASYVTYNFKLSNGGTYPGGFNFGSVRNNEDSRLTTNNYSWRFAAEWISDELKITTGGATNTDLLDRHKNFYRNGICLRSEDTFSDGDNAFATNKSGPIRAIRSIMGANSGPLTQRTHIFYQARQDIITNLRLHSIASIYDALDYNSNANGMKYSNNNNTTAVTINGSKDAVTTGDLSWELASGSKGSVVILHRRSTTFSSAEATFKSYYDDNKLKPASNCTGDGQAWGTSGIGMIFNNSGLCTDPLSTDCGVTTKNYRTLEARRTTYFEAPNASNSTAISYNEKLNNPLSITIGNPETSSSINILQHGEIAEVLVREQKTNKIAISPNPARDVCIVTFHSDNNYKGEITIVGIRGNVLVKNRIFVSNGFNSHRINISNLTPGIYYIKLLDGKKQNVAKLLIR